MAKAASRTPRHPVSVHLGNAIRAQRKRRRLSQTALGDLVGLSHQQIQKYENGSNRMNAVAIYDIALALDCSVGDLFVGLPVASPAPAQDGRAPKSVAQDARLWAELRAAVLRLPPDLRQALLGFLNSLPVPGRAEGPRLDA